MSRHLAYLSLQITREGQASYAHVHEIAGGLRARGWTVTLFEPRAPSGSGWPTLLFKSVAFLTVQFRLWWAARNADAVYVRCHIAALPTSAWAFLSGIPILQEVNGPLEDLPAAYPWTRWLGRPIAAAFWFMVRHANAVVTVTPELCSWIRRNVEGVPVHIIPNGANTELFRPDAAAELLPARPYVVFFGALSRWQGIETLLRALESPLWPRDLNLAVIGDGAERQKVEAAARGDPRLLYLGRQPYHTVPGIVAASLAGIIPKNTVAGHAGTGLCPLKLYETLACGVPAIVTEFPGQADLVREHRCGIVVPPEDPVELARAVRSLFDHRDVALLMGRRGRQAVCREHSWDHRAQATQEAILGVVWGTNGCAGRSAASSGVAGAAGRR